MSLPRGGTPPSGETPTELIRAPISDAAPKRGAVIAGKYRLDRLIARGGMGAVWEAWDDALERRVAIKFMDPDIAMRPALRARFSKEAKAAARLRTPHVVQIIEHGIDADTPYIAMELLEGEDLQRRLKRQKRIGIADLVPIVRQMAKGLQAAHDAGIIHRDLKPQNVFLAQVHGELCVKILDFGVAKVADLQLPGEEGTKTGVVVGSPHYMSPEQARGLPSFDTRSDVWSLGVIVFKALTGHRPFKGEVAGDVIVKICAEPIPRASRTGPGVPRLMDIFFEKALERDPDRRYQTAIQLADAFEEYADEILDDLMKTERWVLPNGMRNPSDSITSLLQTPATALPAARRSEPSLTTTQERRQIPGGKLPSKPGVVAPPDSDVPPPPRAGMADDVPLSSDYRTPGAALDSHTPTTGHTPMTGPSEFSGTVHPATMEIEPATRPVPRSTRRTGMLAAIALGALLIGGAAALAWSSPSTAKSELGHTAEAAAPPPAQPEPEVAPAASAEEDDSLTSEVREEPPDIQPPRVHRPVIRRSPPPAPAASAAPSASAAAPAPEPPPPRPPPPKPRPKSGADWGY